jgi:hypothetical protein
MTRWQIVLLSIFAVCGFGGIAALTNPDRSDYEVYAVEKLADLAKNQCDRAPAGFGTILQGPCRAAIESIKPELRPMVAKATTRQNFILFSMYRSNLSIPAVNLQLHVESIGMFNHFHTYKIN